MVLMHDFHFLTCGYAPMTSWGMPKSRPWTVAKLAQQKFSGNSENSSEAVPWTVAQLAQHSFNINNMMTSCDPIFARCLRAVAIFRGRDINLRDVDDAMTNARFSRYFFKTLLNRSKFLMSYRYGA